MPTEPYDLSTAEAAALLDVHVNSVIKWTDDGLISCRVTFGGHRRYQRSEIERVLREQTKDRTAS